MPDDADRLTINTMFGKQSKNTRLENLEEDADDLWFEVFCDQNQMNINKRLHRLEEFKGGVSKDLKRHEDNISIRENNFKQLEDNDNNLYSLYERLGQKVKDNNTGAKETLLALFKYLGLTLNEQGEVIKVTNKSNAKPIKKSPIKSSKRK